MFIVSKRNYQVRRGDGSLYLIQKSYIGEIPEDVAQSDLVQRAILCGNIAVPEGTKDKELYKADEVAEQLATEHDIRPDAEKAVTDEDASEDAKKSVKTKSGKKE